MLQGLIQKPYLPLWQPTDDGTIPQRGVNGFASSGPHNFSPCLHNKGAATLKVLSVGYRLRDLFWPHKFLPQVRKALSALSRVGGVLSVFPDPLRLHRRTPLRNWPPHLQGSGILCTCGWRPDRSHPLPYHKGRSSKTGSFCSIPFWCSSCGEHNSRISDLKALQSPLWPPLPPLNLLPLEPLT